MFMMLSLFGVWAGKNCTEEGSGWMLFVLLDPSAKRAI